MTNILTIIYAGGLWVIVMFLQNIPEFKSFEGAAGMYAFLFLILKELTQFILKFRKDPTQSQLEIISNTMTKQSNTMVEQSNHMGNFVMAIQETERERIVLIRQFTERMQEINQSVGKILKTVTKRK